MKTSALIATSVAALSFIALPAQAQLTEGWSGEAALSGSATSGNTETTDIGASINLAKEDGPWTNKLTATYDLGKADGVENKNRIFLGYEIDRLINDRLSVFANANYFSDDFGPFKTGSFIGGGLGYKMLTEEPVTWNLQGGAGFRSQRAREVGMIPSVKTEEFALRGASDFDWILNENVSLFNNTEVIWSDSDTYIWNDIGVTANLAGNLAARASFRIDHHTDVPMGRENTDTITRFGIVYTMK